MGKLFFLKKHEQYFSRTSFGRIRLVRWASLSSFRDGCDGESINLYLRIDHLSKNISRIFFKNLSYSFSNPLRGTLFYYLNVIDCTSLVSDFLSRYFAGVLYYIIYYSSTYRIVCLSKLFILWGGQVFT